MTRVASVPRTQGLPDPALTALAPTFETFHRREPC